VQRNIGLDVETSKLPVFRPWQKGAFLVSVGIVDEWGFKKTWYFNHRDLHNIDQAQAIAEIQAEINLSHRIVGHNLKFDLQWLASIGVRFDHCKLFCTQVAEYLLNGQQKIPYTLAATSERYEIAPKIDRVKMFWDSGYETDEIPIEILDPYLLQDCINTLAIFQRQVVNINQLGMSKIVSLQMELMRVLAEMEMNGAKFHPQRAQRYVKELDDQLEAIENELFTHFGARFNLGSGDELSAWLFGGVLKQDDVQPYVTTRNVKIKEPYVFHYADPKKQPVIKYKTRTLKELIVKTRKVKVDVPIAGVGFEPPKGSELKKEGFYRTDKDTLFRLKCKNKKLKAIKRLLEERSVVAKAKETFIGSGEGTGLINKVQHDGLIHPSFNQTIAATGRLSSSNPNGQNLPRKGTSPIKKTIIPRFDKILNADLAQLEWRVAAFMSQDPVAMQEIIDGVDYHTDNAIRFFGADPNGDPAEFKKLRTTAKIFGFRLLYGGSAYGMYMDAKMPNYSKKKWQRIVDEYYEKYAVLKEWQEKNIAITNRNKGKLVNPSGRFFQFPILPPNRRSEVYSVTAIKNYPVQSFATADITPLAMVVIHKRMKAKGLRSLMTLQVHDSIVIDAVESEIPTIAEICVNTFRELPQLIEQFWGFEFNVPLDGDVEVGDDYGSLEEYKMAA